MIAINIFLPALSLLGILPLMLVILSIIALFLFFIVLRLLKRYSNASRPVVWAVIITTITTPLIYLGLIRLFLFSITYEPKRGFSQRKWHSSKSTRYHMAPDMINSKMLVGKDTNEVKRILGSPDIRRPQFSHWQYNMGEGSGGLGFMFHFLRVKLDNDKVLALEHGRVRD